MSIFISIASYQDPLLASTIKGACMKASAEKDLVFGVCDQSSSPMDASSLSKKAKIHYEHIDPILSKGPCWARNRLQSFYQGEDYFLQIDSHTQFDKDWDVILMDQLKSLQGLSSEPYFSKPIITAYPRSFEVISIKDEEFELNSTDDLVYSIAYRRDSIFMKDLFSRQIGRPLKTKDPVHGFLLAAGCLFTEGNFVTEVPYDPNYYFYGEELSMALRAFTRGYSFFHIPDVPLFHLYTDTSDIPRKLHWDPEDDQKRAIKWTELDQKSLNRLNNLFAGKVEEPMNLGDERSLEDYALISGIDLKNNVVLDLEKATESNFLESLDWKISPLKQ